MLDEIIKEIAQIESPLLECMKTLFDTMPLSCGIFDKDCELLFCNQEAVTLFSLHSKQEVNEKFYELSPLYQPEGILSKELFSKYILNAFDGGKTDFEWLFQNFSCEDIPSMVTLVPIKILDEDLVVCFMKDLREIKATEAEIRETDKRNDVMFKSLPLSCGFWDENFEMIDCNNESLKLFNMLDKDTYLQRFHELSPEYQPDGRSSQEKIVEMIKLAFEKGRIRFEWMHQKLNEEQIPVEITLIRVKRNKKNIVIGYTRDLRELKETMSMLEHLENLAVMDSLTNIYNRRYFVEQAEQILSMPLENISIMMIDIDWFKKVNDTYGHLLGDEVLKTVADIMKNELNPEDLLARYGGEEFIILAKIDSEQAEILAERIRYKISNHYFKYVHITFRVTVSIGLMTRREGNVSLIDCIRSADSALYKAKKQGRDCVEIAWAAFSSKECRDNQ